MAMDGQRRASWTYVFLLACLVRPATGFLGNAYVGLRRAESCGTWDILRTAADLGSRCRRSSTLPRPAGVGGLSAALEVELTRDVEIGSVLVAGPDNYGHMTFKVLRGSRESSPIRQRSNHTHI